MPGAELALAAHDAGGVVSGGRGGHQRGPTAVSVDSRCHSSTHTLRRISGKNTHTHTHINMWLQQPVRLVEQRSIINVTSSLFDSVQERKCTCKFAFLELDYLLCVVTNWSWLPSDRSSPEKVYMPHEKQQFSC